MSAILRPPSSAQRLLSVLRPFPERSLGLIAFDAGSPGTYLPTARTSPPQPANPVQPLPEEPNPNIRWPHQTDVNTASPGPNLPPAPSAVPYIFQESQHHLTRPHIHFQLHRIRTSRWPLLKSLPPRRAVRSNRPLLHISSGSCAQTPHRHVLPHRRSVLSLGQSTTTLGQRRYRCRPVSHCMGHIRQSREINSPPPTQFYGCHIRHLGSVQTHPDSTRPAARCLYNVGRQGVRRPSCHVWSCFECWSLWRRGRHAHRDLRKGWLHSYNQMGRRLPSDPPPRPNLVRGRFHEPDCSCRSALESEKAASFCIGATLHWLRLGLKEQDGRLASRKGNSCHESARSLGAPWSHLFRARSSEPAQQTHSLLLHLSTHSSFPPLHLLFCPLLPFKPCQFTPTIKCASRHLLDTIPPVLASTHTALDFTIPCRPRLVGRRKHLFWCQYRAGEILGGRQVGTGFHRRTRSHLHHWLGRSRCGRAGAPISPPAWLVHEPFSWQSILHSSVRQRRGSDSSIEGSIKVQRDKPHPQAHLSPASKIEYPPSSRARTIQTERCRCPIPRRYLQFPAGLSHGPTPLQPSYSRPPFGQVDITVMSLRFQPPSFPDPDPPHPTDSSLNTGTAMPHSIICPNCPASQRIFQWRGIHHPPFSHIDSPFIHHVRGLAAQASLCDTAGYGAGVRKFHIFCDIFSIPESQRLPASFEILHSFVLWATADPACVSSIDQFRVWVEPVSVSVARKYLAAIRAWHIIQGWPPPLSDQDAEMINWSLRGMERLQKGSRTRPPRPPVTLPMLASLKANLDLSTPFAACIWAMVSCAFWGMMRFGEVSVKSRSSFNGTTHLKQSDTFFRHDLNGNLYVTLSLPSAKTAAPGESHAVFMTPHDQLCPIQALLNLATMVPAGPNDPLFSWRDKRGAIRPMVKHKAIAHINSILVSHG